MITSNLDSLKIKGYFSSGTLDREESSMQIHRYMTNNSRKGKLYCDLRTSPKTGYESPEEFLVHSVQNEVFPEESNISVSFENQVYETCTVPELNTIVTDLRQRIPWFIRILIIPFVNSEKVFPNLSEIESVIRIGENSDFNWLFIEEKKQFHSLFWNTIECKI